MSTIRSALAKLEEAMEVIARCEQKDGFSASTQPQRGLALRDMVISEDILLGLGYEATVKRQLEGCLKMQEGGDGSAPMTQEWKLCPDNNILLLIGMMKYAEATGDLEFPKKNSAAQDACLRAIEAKQNEFGFVEGMDWRDAMRDHVRKYLLSNQVLLVRMFKSLRMRDEADDLKTNIRKLFFSAGRGFYADCLWWSDGELKKDFGFDCFGNALAIQEDISPNSATRVADQFKSAKSQFGQRNIWPARKERGVMVSMQGLSGFLRNGSSNQNAPDHYQNSAIWPFVEVTVIHALLRLGLQEEAQDLSQLMLNMRGVAEWYDPLNGEPKGSKEQLLSAAAIVSTCWTLHLNE
jgi:hypothetical protein